MEIHSDKIRWYLTSLLDVVTGISGIWKMLATHIINDRMREKIGR